MTQDTEQSAYSQIAFEFESGPAPALPENEAAEVSPQVNVGVRLKALKQAATPPDAVSGPVKKKSNRGRKSLKEAAIDASLLHIPPDDVLFSRQYYSIGEVAAMFQVNTSLIRFWEKEFDILQPRKNRKGDRHFRPEDIKNLQLIYDLLRRRKLTIEGAREFLKQQGRARERYELIEGLRKLRGFLLELKSSL